MINVKILDLLNSVEILRKLSQQDFKAKTAWQVARLLKAAEGEIQSFGDTRMNLIMKYAEKDENGELIKDENDNVKLIPENVATFTTELNDLLETEVEINANKLTLEQLDDADFTPSEIAMLEPFVADETIEGN